MKTMTIVEEPVMCLSYSDYNASGNLDVYPDMLWKAAVGTVFAPCVYNTCGRGVTSETLELIYKSARGCACLYRREGTTDSPSPEAWADDPQLIWFELHKEGAPA